MLHRIPFESKIIIGLIMGAIGSGIYVGGRKIMYDPDIQIFRSKSSLPKHIIIKK